MSLREEFDAAIGPTPPPPDRISALSARYGAWRRRRAVAASVAGVALLAGAAGTGIALAGGGGGSPSPQHLGQDITTSPTTSDTTSPTASPSDSFTAQPGASATTAAPGTASTAPGAAGVDTTASPTGTSALQGTVVNQAGQPLSGVWVTGWGGTTRTDASGHFVAPTTDGHNGGCLVFTVQPIYAAATEPPAAGDYAWQEWLPHDGCHDTSGDIRITMQPGADVFGTVRDTNGNPVAGVSVFSSLGRGTVVSSSCCPSSFQTITDNEGRYRIYGLQPTTTMMALREPWGYGPGAGAPYQTQAGSGSPFDLTDYGSGGCDSTSPPSPCPNYTNNPDYTPTPTATDSQTPTPSETPTPSSS